MTKRDCLNRPAIAIALAVLVSAARGAPLKPADYAQPKRLTAAIYETASGTNKILYTFQRTATVSNSAVHVVCDFLEPNGSLAAREQIVFERDRLVSIQLDQRQAGARGSATVAPDPKNAGKAQLLFEWTAGDKRKTNHEGLQPETLVAMMIPYFIVAHWDELERGQPAPFRYIVPERLETVGFRFVKERDVTWRGRSAVRLRMEASNFVVARIVDPLFFIVEKDGAHRVLEYVGRTTPKRREGSSWKDLDARTVYDW